MTCSYNCEIININIADLTKTGHSVACCHIEHVNLFCTPTEHVFAIFCELKMFNGINPVLPSYHIDWWQIAVFF